jgi:type II secretory pathway pseudopilin PulG
MSLLELTAVVLIIGLVGAVVVTSYGGSAVADAGAQGFARRLALDCLQARRRAISTGDNHLLRFTLAGGEATQYALYRRQGAALELVDSLRPVPDDVTVGTAGAVDVEFAFTGEALASHAITVQGPHRSLTVVVFQVTGRAVVQ